jgi:uncharacterized membrane protein
MRFITLSSRTIAPILLLFSVVGLLASFVLLHETFAVANNPGYAPSCNISPLMSCESAMKSQQGESFGIPNPAFGIAAFSMLLAFAVLLLVGTQFSAWVWRLGVLAAVGGLGFALYLYFTAIFVLGSICPWCFVTWVVTVGIFWAMVTQALKEKAIPLPRWASKVAGFWSKNAGLVLAILYAALIFGLLIRFNQAFLA